MANSPVFLVIGLGNPGQRYSGTRHNVGWWVLDELARRHAARRSYRRHQSEAAALMLEGREVLLIRPQTYMNLSGGPIAAWRRESPQTPWVLIHDDTAFDPGQLRLRRSGSAGGHNGVESVIAALHSQQFDRLRIGVGKPGPQTDLADYVLRPPVAAELALLAPAIARAAEVVELLVAGHFERAALLASGSPPDPRKAAREDTPNQDQ